MPESEGQAIKRLRKRRGWSTDDLATQSGFERGSVNRIELDKQRANPSTLRGLMRALKPAATDIGDHPRLLEALRDSASGGEGGGARIEDHLAELLAHIKTLDGEQRTYFIDAVSSLLNALKHARPAASSGTPANNDR